MRENASRASGPRGPLAQMRVRKKLIVLHTVFTLILAAVVLLAMRPAISRVVREAEGSVAVSAARGGLAPTPTDARSGLRITRVVLDTHPEASTAREAPGGIALIRSGSRAVALQYREATGDFVELTAVVPAVRAAVVWLYAFVVGALLLVYALVAVALEVFVLPRHVYGPIRRMLAADRAVQEGHASREVIPENTIPADELGEIMRSRNASVVKLRQQERELEDAILRLEAVATDLRQKNHLLETAKRNLADADRLASLGMMSAGLAHEMNTPLAVAKGLAERLARDEHPSLSAMDAALLLRVITRLEKLGESLLDVARARPPERVVVRLAELADEAIMLVRLDRESASVGFTNAVGPEITLSCDQDRILQVLVNLVRNAVDALRSNSIEGEPPEVRIEARVVERESVRWIALKVIDNGPGIPPDVLPRVFEPFVSSHLDARGTGIGLAVAEGIAREHGGVLTAKNRGPRPGAGAMAAGDSMRGAEFEMLLPAEPGSDPHGE